MPACHAMEMALEYSRQLEEVKFSLWYQQLFSKSRLSEKLPELALLRKLALHLHPATTEATAEAIDRNRGVRELEFGGEGLSHEGLRRILKAIGSCHQLTSLHLIEIRVSPTNAKRFSQLLVSPSSCLTKLSLDEVTIVLVDAVLESLRSNATLEKLSLSRVRQQGACDNMIRISALKTNKVLKNLQVHECLVDTTDLADMLKVNSAVEELELTVCQLADEDVIVLAEALEVNRTLQKIDVTDNRLSADSVTVFARSLTRNDRLQVIDMGYVYFTPDCEESVANVLRETKACGRLRVYWNKAGLLELESVLSDFRASMQRLCLDWRADAGVSSAIVGIFAALSVNATVTELIIEDGFSIDDAIGEQLALTLRYNTSLKHLSIKNYFRKHAIVIGLLEALEDNRSVSTLHLNYSIKSAQVAKALCEMLEKNKTIYSMEFDGWHLKGKTLLELAESISQNSVLLEFKLAMTCYHKHFAGVYDAIRRNRVFMKRAVRFVMQHSEDEESQCAFSVLNGKESLLQTLVKVTGKTEPEVKAIIEAAAHRAVCNSTPSSE